MKSIEQALGFHNEDDLNALNNYLRTEIRMGRPEKAEQLLRALLENMLHDKQWIRKAKAEIASELGRIAGIGDTMKRAGLRSYTDKEGRIFVAEDDRGKAE